MGVPLGYHSIVPDLCVTLIRDKILVVRKEMFLPPRHLWLIPGFLQREYIKGLCFGVPLFPNLRGPINPKLILIQEDQRLLQDQPVKNSTTNVLDLSMGYNTHFISNIYTRTLLSKRIQLSLPEHT